MDKLTQATLQYFEGCDDNFKAALTDFVEGNYEICDGDLNTAVDSEDNTDLMNSVGCNEKEAAAIWGFTRGYYAAKNE